MLTAILLGLIDNDITKLMLMQDVSRVRTQMQRAGISLPADFTVSSGRVRRIYYEELVYGTGFRLNIRVSGINTKLMQYTSHVIEGPSTGMRRDRGEFIDIDESKLAARFTEMFSDFESGTLTFTSSDWPGLYTVKAVLRKHDLPIIVVYQWRTRGGGPLLRPAQVLAANLAVDRRSGEIRAAYPVAAQLVYDRESPLVDIAVCKENAKVIDKNARARRFIPRRVVTLVAIEQFQPVYILHQGRKSLSRGWLSEATVRYDDGETPSEEVWNIVFDGESGTPIAIVHSDNLRFRV